MAILKEMTVNVPFVEALEKMPGYAKFMKDLVTKKRIVSYEPSLCDLGASINLISLAVYKKLGLGDPTPTNMRLVMTDRLVKRPVGILYDVLVKVASFIFLAYFIILDCEVEFEVPIILGRPFLKTKSVLIDLRANALQSRFNDEVVHINVCQSMKKPKEISLFSIVDVYYEGDQEVTTEDKFDVETLLQS
ncbi:uncharacterized protein LOC124895685 [Capsicum annuum]|uniref:uncharacterized protein LOC124895629 n=1 Tax=Capsicum annuum TaxID=4072 RepID=UPI001FB1375D|nr:uncharacterized protein LOC124895629 [Capsicum annuum]XP_047262072.1 uncharacterized protein LOC124895683 [Capsicum annuum]XP_047262073.1 uncharacterized protein LOC124895685 [Capsicum annuum]